MLNESNKQNRPKSCATNLVWWWSKAKEWWWWQCCWRALLVVATHYTYPQMVRGHQCL